MGCATDPLAAVLTARVMTPQSGASYGEVCLTILSHKLTYRRGRRDQQLAIYAAGAKTKPNEYSFERPLDSSLTYAACVNRARE